MRSLEVRYTKWPNQAGLNELGRKSSLGDWRWAQPALRCRSCSLGASQGAIMLIPLEGALYIADCFGWSLLHYKTLLKSDLGNKIWDQRSLIWMLRLHFCQDVNGGYDLEIRFDWMNANTLFFFSEFKKIPPLWNFVFVDLTKNETKLLASG